MNGNSKSHFSDDQFFSGDRSQPAHHPFFPGMEDNIHGSQDLAAPAQETGPQSWVAEVVLPEKHEPAYAYPVLIWLHGDGQTEQDAIAAIHRASDQNIIGIALRGDAALRSGYTWNASPAALSNFLEALLLSLSVRYRINADRVFIGGYESGANLAMQLMLEHPATYCGAALLSPRLKSLSLPTGMTRLARGRRILVASQLTGSPAHLMDLVEFDRQLEQLGLEVRSRYYQPTTRKLTTRMLRDVDHWMISSLISAVGV
jgi:phospholipase/carboxylesterase